MSKAGTRHVRAPAIEIARGMAPLPAAERIESVVPEAVWGRKQSRVKRNGIVALARELLVALWRYLETRLIPQGAVLKTRLIWSEERAEAATGQEDMQVGVSVPVVPPGFLYGADCKVGPLTRALPKTP